MISKILKIEQILIVFIAFKIRVYEYAACYFDKQIIFNVKKGLNLQYAPLMAVKMFGL